jgi:DNA (cytosine-5)-methyltransferase 1
VNTPRNPFYAARVSQRSPVPLYRVLDLFSGIGGFSLGLGRAGMTTAAFCEIDSNCRRVLNARWPGTPIFHDIKTLNIKELPHGIDIICGGYPCQPFSIAGRQRGERDPRHLWPEMFRLICELRPRWVICENVSGHVDNGLDAVLSQLEREDYTCWPFLIPACAIGAPHWRERVWIVAHATRQRRSPCVPKRTAGSRPQSPNIAQSASEELARLFSWIPEPDICRVDDGIPDALERLSALGNAVVPQIPEIIGRAIIAYESNLAAAA